MHDDKAHNPRPKWTALDLEPEGVQPSGPLPPWSDEIHYPLSVAGVHVNTDEERAEILAAIDAERRAWEAVTDRETMLDVTVGEFFRSVLPQRAATYAKADGLIRHLRQTGREVVIEHGAVRVKPLDGLTGSVVAMVLELQGPMGEILDDERLPPV